MALLYTDSQVKIYPNKYTVKYWFQVKNTSFHRLLHFWKTELDRQVLKQI